MRPLARITLVATLILSIALLSPPAIATEAKLPCWGHVEGVPEGAYILEDFILSHNYSPPKGFAGGKIFQNEDRQLPSLKGPVEINYLEYDLYPKVPDQPRRPERVVITRHADPLPPGRSYYSPDHYTMRVIHAA